ncbi:unnamed protein product [Meganyctiphanes norvegica]|uniref:Uncharacterized protein n=1 Tax=Meganyctiphanes norvegica TaxID=48144 RepID=A0AAV2QTX2_MEGNR
MTPITTPRTIRPPSRTGGRGGKARLRPRPKASAGGRRTASARPVNPSSMARGLQLSGSLDDLGNTDLMIGSSPDLSRPQSAASDIPSAASRQSLSRASSSLARSQSMRCPRTSSRTGSRRPGSSMSNLGSPGGSDGYRPGSADCWTPRPLGVGHRSTSTVSLADSQILAKFMDGIDAQVPEKDRRILEILAMKHERTFLEEERSNQAHRAWNAQKDRERKESAKRWAEWKNEINEKRRKENMVNMERWQQSEELYLQSHENLVTLLNEKEHRHNELLDNQTEARIRRMEERREIEELRKKSQMEARQVLEEAEERKRQHLIQMWEQQEQLVMQRRKEREEFFKKRLGDGNAAEHEAYLARKHAVEERGEQLLLAMRNNMDEKLQRAEENLAMLHEVQNLTLNRQREERDRRATAVRALHHQLEVKMLQWRQHVMKSVMDGMEQAEQRADHHLQARAQRVQQDRTLRQQHHKQQLQQVQAQEEAELYSLRKNLELKDQRSLYVSREKENAVEKARSVAITTSNLRDTLKSKLDPVTFDKMAARAKVELRLEARIPATSVEGCKSSIFLG